MRVTENTTANVVFNNLQINRQRTELLQQQASTGVKVSNPGDDPIAAQQILLLKAHLAASGQYARNIQFGKTWLQQMEGAMGEMGNTIVRAKEIAVAMSNGTYDSNTRLIAMNEVKQLKNQMVQLGNTQIGGKYVFGGYVTDTTPFATDMINNTILGPPVAADPLNGTVTGEYVGTTDAVNVEVDQGAYVSINYPGINAIGEGDPVVAGVATTTGSGIIKELNELIIGLNNNDMTRVNGALDGMDTSLNQILTVRSDIGARINRMDSAANVITDMDYTLNKIISDRQDVDMMKVISDLTRQQTAFEATLAASAKITQISLLDYLN